METLHTEVKQHRNELNAVSAKSYRRGKAVARFGLSLIAAVSIHSFAGTVPDTTPTLLAATTSPSASVKSGGDVKQQITGTWVLKSYVETNMDTGEKTYPMGQAPSGFIMYTSDGYMSAQISGTGRERFEKNDMFGGTAKEYTAAGQSYLAYSGPYVIDPVAHKLTHTISVSLYPNWAGLNQVRNFRVEDDKRLYLSFERPQMSRGAMRTADLVWERASPN